MPDALPVVLLDNVDSFSDNLVEEFARRGHPVRVHRNDRPVEEILAAATGRNRPALLVISPGPGSPREAGSSIPTILAAAGRVPVLGVCLGHQAIVEAFGGTVGPAPEILHGKASPTRHDGSALFAGLPDPMLVARYHSLAATAVPAALRVTARAGETVMAVAHRELPIVGVQFHPESVLTPSGPTLIDNVLRWAADARR
ncbi:MAG: aminodeoxychorismate/anthranilate synthase component II [Gemmatimonadales bacterium]